MLNMHSEDELLQRSTDHVNDRETCFRRRRDWNDVDDEKVNFEQAKDQKKVQPGTDQRKEKSRHQFDEQDRLVREGAMNING